MNSERNVPRHTARDDSGSQTRANAPRQTAEADDHAAPREGPKTEEEAVERINTPPAPDPSQAEADEIKEGALGVDGGDGEPAPPTEAPTVVDVPHVSGTDGVGDTLTCTMGNWTGEPSGYAYQWQRDGADFAATDATYVVAAEDAGHSLACVVTATNAIGSTVAPPSNAVAVPATGTRTTRRERAMTSDPNAPGYQTR